MDIPKSKVTKIISAIKKCPKKVYTTKELAFDIGIKEEILKEYFFSYNPLIYFSEDFNLKDILNDLINEEKENNKNNKKSTVKRQYIRQKDIAPYENLIDYIYKNCTVDGGILDTGYVFNKKDVKIISKLLKEEKERLEAKK